jgi:hypothetical protein
MNWDFNQNEKKKISGSPEGLEPMVEKHCSRQVAQIIYGISGQMSFLENLKELIKIHL